MSEELVELPWFFLPAPEAARRFGCTVECVRRACRKHPEVGHLVRSDHGGAYWIVDPAELAIVSRPSRVRAEARRWNLPVGLNAGQIGVMLALVPLLAARRRHDDYRRAELAESLT